MRIHKSTSTNVTVCGIATPGKVMSINWRDVDCVRCLKAGGMYQAPNDDTPSAENEQQELFNTSETGDPTK